MKLKFYMRGLGIGIMVTALIMGIATKDRRPLTDAEIRAAAVKLGMVDGGSLKLTDLPQGGATDSPKSDQAEEQSQSGGQDGEEPESEQSESERAENEVDETDPEESDPTPSPDPSPTPSPDPTPSPAPTPEESSDSDMETIKFVIKSGTGSRAVCNQLAEAGLIENAAAFDQYLIDSGYSKRISAGTFEIPVGASEEEIAKIISRSR